MNTKQKIALVKIGHPKHLDTLVHDKDPWVRWRVAKYGNKNHATQLLNDSSDYVRKAAKNRLNKLGEEK